MKFSTFSDGWPVNFVRKGWWGDPTGHTIFIQYFSKCSTRDPHPHSILSDQSPMKGTVTLFQYCFDRLKDAFA